MNSIHSKTFLSGFLALIIVSLAGCGKTDAPAAEGIEVTEAPQGSEEIFLTSEQFNTMKMEWRKTR